VHGDFELFHVLVIASASGALSQNMRPPGSAHDKAAALGAG
jgi:hypothetical protein